MEKAAARKTALRLHVSDAPPEFASYADDPKGYISEVLKLTLTPDMESVLDALQSHRKVLASAGHSVGKSTLGAALVNWWFDTRKPSICLTTAPTDRQVKDILWKEVRTQRARAGLPDRLAGPKIPRLETSADHFAHGYTARDATRFQGQHSRGGLLIIFDEAEGVEQPFWEALPSMLDDKSFFVGFYNPTGQQTAAHRAELQAEQHGTYRKVNLSCLRHPNIIAEQEGKPRPIPGAITLRQLRDMLLEDSTILPPAGPKLPTDIELQGIWYRPGPIALARCLGIRSTESTVTLWSEELWKRVLQTLHTFREDWPVVVGCDVGRYGDDHSVICVRKGYKLLHIETHVKQPTNVIAQRIKEVCSLFEDRYNPQKRIPCMIDEGGIGAGVIDQGSDYLFIPVNAACKPRNPLRYPRVRDELWFVARQAALEGLMDVSAVQQRQPSTLQRLFAELSVAKYEVINGKDMVKVSSKDDMKAVLGKSPDLADAFNLCWYPPE